MVKDNPVSSELTKSLELTDLNWISCFLYIISKTKGLCLLEPNIGQLLLYNSIMEQRKRGLPIRILLLKPRQVGWSTFIAAWIYAQIFRNPYKHGLVISLDNDKTYQIFRMIQIFDDYLPDWLKKPKQASNRYEILYERPHESQFTTQTQGSKKGLRGGMTHYLHCSEVAFWDDTNKTLGEVFQWVPETDPNSAIFLETTANGIGEPFEQRYSKAVAKRRKNPDDYTGYQPVFFPWYLFPEYTFPLQPGQIIKPEDSAEKYLIDHKCTPGQLLWRRLKIESFDGDVSFFKQEYPATSKEAFQATGRNVFPPATIERLEKLTRKPLGFYKFIKEGGFIKPVKTDCPEEAWEIWHMPQPDHEYVIGCDTMEGQLSDPDNEKSDPDWHGVVVFDKMTFETVAHYHGRCNQLDLGRQVEMAGHFYRQAMIAPEMPNGLGVITYLQQVEYPNLFHRDTNEESEDNKESNLIGWKTTTKTRPAMVDLMRDILKDNEITIYSALIVEEMKTFVRNKQGKPEHMRGKHDDLLFGLMIALQVTFKVGFSTTYNIGNHTYDTEEKNTSRDLNVLGAVDDWLPEAEDTQGTHTE